MPTFKTSNPEILNGYDDYTNGQYAMLEYFNAKAKEFGFTGARVVQWPLERTLFRGFLAENPDTVDRVFWRMDKVPGEAPRYWLRSRPKPPSRGPEKAAEFKGLQTRWAEMIKASPAGGEDLWATPWLNSMGIHNHLSFFGCGSTLIISALDDQHIYISFSQRTPQEWEPEEKGWTKWGWEECLGSEFEKARAELELKAAEEKWAKESDHG